MNKLVSLFYLFSFFNSFSYAQKSSVQIEKQKIEVISRVTLDSVVLRWAPSTPEAWQYGNKYGYRIERLTLAKEKNNFTLNNPEKKRLNDQLLKPLSLNQWEPLARKNKYAAIAAQALYGETFSVKQAKQNIMTMISKTKEVENRYSFSLFAADQSFEVAYGMGLGWIDRTIQPNEKYLYKVYMSNPKNILKVDTAFLYVNMSEPDVIPAPSGLKVNFEDHLATLRWNSFYFENLFSSYIIERSEEGKNFICITQEPIISLRSDSHSSTEIIFTDSLSSNEVNYTYRIKGITPFGEISNSSNEVSGKGKKASPDEPPVITKKELNTKNQVVLSWTFDEKDHSTITGFAIYRASKADGPYELLNKGNSVFLRSWTDENPQATNYYIVKAIGIDQKEKGSYPVLVQLEDNIPPSPPIDLKGKIDSLGVVRLSWKKNIEKDISGYRVFMANDSTDRFAQITSGQIFINRFIDTISIDLLNTKIYYKVAAVDNHFNTSKFSKTLELKRPDRNPPVAPIIDQIEVSEKGIYIHWQKSSSKDVIKHELYRKEKKEKDWVLIQSFDNKVKNEYTDKVKGKDIEYEYKIISIDESNLSSSSNLVKAYPIVEKIDAIKDLSATTDRKNKCIILTWKTIQSADQLIIYRSEEGKPFRTHKIIANELLDEWKDEQLTIGSTYSYYIQATWIDGSKSNMSLQVKATY